MCESNAYLRKQGEDELLMEAVDIIEPLADGGFRLIGIFGDQKIVRGRLVVMNLINHRIVFEEEHGHEHRHDHEHEHEHDGQRHVHPHPHVHSHAHGHSHAGGHDAEAHEHGHPDHDRERHEHEH